MSDDAKPGLTGAGGTRMGTKVMYRSPTGVLHYRIGCFADETNAEMLRLGDVANPDIDLCGVCLDSHAKQSVREYLQETD